MSNSKSFLKDDQPSLRVTKRANDRSESILARVVNQFQIHGSLGLIGAIFQIVLGTLVVSLALLQAIQPIWLAGLLTVLGSLSILLGTYTTYTSVSRSTQAKQLIDEAIERVIQEKN
jgi:hypothetical protein